MTDQRYDQAVLVQFAASLLSRSGLADDRAKTVADQLEMRGIKPSVVHGFGKDMPIASNDTEDGREKNRRVEVWLR